MSDDHDRALARLVAADPASADAPPQRGSARFAAIQEHAMTATTPPVPTPRPARPARPARPRLRLGLVPAGAVAAALAVVVAVAGPFDGEPASAQQLVRTAAQSTADATTFRARLVAEGPDGREVVTAAFAGGDARIVGADGTVTTLVGDRVWERDARGRTTTDTVPAAERLAPFARSSAAVLLAALAGDAARLGEERVGGAAATHVRIALTPAARRRLAELPATQLAWFELEDPDRAERVDVWVDGDLIRRIAIVSRPAPGGATTTTTTEFSDFGAAVQVRPPR